VLNVVQNEISLVHYVIFWTLDPVGTIHYVTFLQGQQRLPDPLSLHTRLPYSFLSNKHAMYHAHLILVGV
jgi:hypothetical protein